MKYLEIISLILLISPSLMLTTFQSYEGHAKKFLARDVKTQESNSNSSDQNKSVTQHKMDNQIIHERLEHFIDRDPIIRDKISHGLMNENEK